MKLSNLRKGVLRLAELSKVFVAQPLELTIVVFNDYPRVVLEEPRIPPLGQLQTICNGIRPAGATDIGRALKMALDIAGREENEGKIVHVVLITDGTSCFAPDLPFYGLTRWIGQDTNGLPARMSIAEEPLVHILKTCGSLYIHAIGIDAAADCNLLDTIARTARRGIFLFLKDDNINALMGTLFGFMYEAVDSETLLSLRIDGEAVMTRKDVVLRVCNPPIPCRVPIERIVVGATKIEAELVVGASTVSRAITIGPCANEAVRNVMDPVCAELRVRKLKGDCDKSVAEYLGQRKFDAAAECNACVRVEIAEFMAKLDVLEALKFGAEAIVELEAQHKSILAAKTDPVLYRCLEGRTLSGACTSRNNGLSLDPESGASLSDLQSQLI